MPTRPYNGKFAGKHVVITGGSEGIGLSIGSELVSAGAHVTIMARSAEKLKKAQELLHLIAIDTKSGSKVSIEAMDVTVYDQVQTAMLSAEQSMGPIDILVCNAGSSTPGYFHDQDVEVFERMMKLNYMGSLHTVKAVYDGMVKRNSGHIVFISSTMALMGFTGYAAYAPSKYAVRGLAECLRNELQGTGVKVSIGFPPDTKTPGFDIENLSKPLETQKISEGSKPFPSGQVARTLLAGLQREDFVLPNPDIGLQIHSTAVKGMIPRRALWLLPEMLLSCFAPIIHLIFASSMDKVARKNVTKRFSKLWGAQSSE